MPLTTEDIFSKGGLCSGTGNQVYGEVLKG